MFWLNIWFEDLCYEMLKIPGVLFLISVLEIGWLFSEGKRLIPSSNQKHVGLRLVEDGEDTLGDFYYYLSQKIGRDRTGSAFDPLRLSSQEVRKYTIKTKGLCHFARMHWDPDQSAAEELEEHWSRRSFFLVSNAPFGARISSFSVSYKVVVFCPWHWTHMNQCLLYLPQCYMPFGITPLEYRSPSSARKPEHLSRRR